MPDRKSSTAQGRGKNALEWVVFGMSSALVVAMIAVLVVTAIRWEGRPPELVAKLGEPELKDHIVTVAVEVTNHGDIAASDVEIEVTRSTGGEEQSASVVLDFVPRHGTRRGQVSFPAPSEAGAFKVAGIGFAEP
ncbi:MAG TPA: hypothetical protein VGE67_00015 [Haloferula sp.]